MCRDMILDLKKDLKKDQAPLDVREPMFNVGHAWAAAT